MVVVLAETASFFLPFPSTIVFIVTAIESLCTTTLSPTAGTSTVSTIVICGIVIVSHFVTTVGANNSVGSFAMAFFMCQFAEQPMKNGIVRARDNHFTALRIFPGLAALVKLV